MDKSLEEVFLEDGSMAIEDANRIAKAIDGSEQTHVLDFLRNVTKCDGSPTESKLAAIIRGLILARNQDD